MDRLRSSMAKPGGARLVGILVALAGVALLAVGVIALGGGNGSSGAAPAPSTTTPLDPSGSVPPSAATSAQTSAPATPSRSPAPAPTRSQPAPTTSAPAPQPTRTPAARVPLTVLNNSTIAGLADTAAGEAQRRGWQIAQVGNFAGRLPATTVYYDPGSATQEAAARRLAREFPQVTQVLPRYAGLPPTPTGIVLVVTKDW